MYRILLPIILMCLALVACSTEKPPVAQEAQTGEDEQRMPRRRIDKLDSRTFAELTIDLVREEAKWNAEWARYMQEKRSEYYASFGLTEKQFNDFPLQNAAELQRFLSDNPQYSRQLEEARMHSARRQP